MGGRETLALMKLEGTTNGCAKNQLEIKQARFFTFGCVSWSGIGVLTVGFR